jgi:hypothetical protein
MENEKLLPKPLTDLPLPEKEIPANLASQNHALQNSGNVLKSKFFWGFIGLSFLIAFIIGGIMLAK